jgi:flagellar hook-length control protein FliK
MPAPSAQGTIDAGPIPIRGQQAPKIQQPQLIQQTQRPQQPQQIQPPQEALAGEQSAGVRAVANIVTGVAIAKGQETALPVEAAGRQIPTVPRMPQETTTAPVVQVAQTMARGVRAGRAETPNERVQSSPGARVVNPAPQVNRQETPAPVKSAPGGQPGVAGEKPEHASAKTQPVNPQPTAGPETPVEGGKVPQGQALPVEGRQDRTSRFSAVARSEGPKAEAVQTNGKDTPSPDPKEAGAAMPEMRVSPVGDAVAPSPRLATQTQSQTSVDAPPVRSPVQSVGEQIRDSMHASAARGDRQILIRLNPPELGTVLVRFQEQGDHFNGTLEVSSRETRREIEQALPQVVRALQEAGVQIRRVEVVTSDQAESDPGGEHQPRDVWQQHQGTGQGREHSHGSSRVRWQQSAGGHSTIGQDTPDDEPQAAAAPGRIDVLL